MRFTTLAVLILAVAVQAAPVPKALKKPNDAKAILGTWSGHLAPVSDANAPPTYTMQFFEDGTSAFISGGSAPSPSEYTLDPDSSPKKMRWLHDKSKTEYKCLYAIEGDTLKVGFGYSGKELPNELTSQPGILALYELKRVSPSK